MQAEYIASVSWGFYKNKSVLIEEVIPDQLRLFLVENLKYENYFSINDNGVIVNAIQCYAPLAGEMLLNHFAPTISQLVGKEVVGTFSMSRHYGKTSELRKHRDRSAGEFSLSLCLEHDGGKWPFCCECDGKVKEYNVRPGDAVLYAGSSIHHWRGHKDSDYKHHFQLFLQWVDKFGPHSNSMYDRRPALGMPIEFQSDDGYPIED